MRCSFWSSQRATASYSRHCPHQHTHKGSARRHRATRQLNATALFAGSGRVRDLWAYDGSCVQELNLDTFKFIHRMSFGHRNRRTVVVVVYDPADPACQAAEFQVEQLASGLQHESEVLVAKLNITRSDPGPISAALSAGSASQAIADFAANVLEIKQLPSVLLYPEGAPGFMRYVGAQDGSPLQAEALLSALNKCQRKVLPNRAPLQLMWAPTATSDAASTVPASQAWSAEMLASATASQSAATAVPTSSTAQQQQQTQAVTQATSATVASSQRLQQRQVLTDAASTPTWYKAHGQPHWGPHKAAIWGGILLLSMGIVAWEQWLGPVMQQRAVLARQAKRQAGQVDEEDTDVVLEDLYLLREMGVTAPAAVTAPKQRPGPDTPPAGPEDASRQTIDVRPSMGSNAQGEQGARQSPQDSQASESSTPSELTVTGKSAGLHDVQAPRWAPGATFTGLGMMRVRDTEQPDPVPTGKTVKAPMSA